MPCASRRRGDAARRHADTLRFVLFEARPAGLLFHQLTRTSGLSDSQVRIGLAFLRDIIAENGWPPLIWTRADGYQLGAEPAALQAYERAVLSTCLRSLDRKGVSFESTQRCGIDWRVPSRTWCRGPHEVSSSWGSGCWAGNVSSAPSHEVRRQRASCSRTSGSSRSWTSNP